VQLVRLIFNYRDAQLGQAQADLEPLGQNTFAVEGAYLSQAGAWDLTGYIRRRGMDDVLVKTSLAVPPPGAVPSGAATWQSPVPGLPPGLAVAALLMVVGVIPLIWHQPLRQARPRLFPVLRLAGAILFLVGLVLGAGSLPDARASRLDGNPVPASPDSIAAGAELYRAQCVSCHGVNGRGDGPLALTLNPRPADLSVHTVPGVHTDLELYDWITNGFPGSAMPAFAQILSDTQRWHLVNYIRTLAPKE
jgi:mono/diheme cytochrome c family protein